MPENLRVVAQDPYAITIRWDDKSVNEDEFIIYRSQFIDGSWQVAEYTRVGTDVTEYTDTDVVCGDYHYVYRVAANNTNGRSSKTPRLDVATNYCPDGEIPPSVTGLTATVVNSTTITLTWMDNAIDEQFMIVSRRLLTASDEAIIAWPDENVTNYLSFAIRGAKSPQAH